MLSACGGRNALVACTRAAGAALSRVLLHGSSQAAAAAEAQPAASAAATLLADPDFDLTEDQQQFKHVAEMFAREELAPFRCFRVAPSVCTPVGVSCAACGAYSPAPCPIDRCVRLGDCSAEWDEKHHFPVETLRKAADLGAPLAPR